MEFNIIKQHIEKLMELMGISDFSIEFKEIEDSPLAINIKMSEPQILIGRGGSTLITMQHIIKRLVYKKDPTFVNFTIDINNYRKERERLLRELADEAASKVRLQKKSVIFPPMSAYERRIIHLQLAGDGYIATESIGEEPYRKVVIRAYS